MMRLPVRDVQHSPINSTEVKNEWNQTSITTYIRAMHSNNFNFSTELRRFAVNFIYDTEFLKLINLYILSPCCICVSVYWFMCQLFQHLSQLRNYYKVSYETEVVRDQHNLCIS
jgi:hypothetical protein